MDICKVFFVVSDEVVVGDDYKKCLESIGKR